MTSARPTSRAERAHTLDALRGVAALLVAAYHFGTRAGGFVPGGYLAVDLFFVLSGYVIALNYSDRLLSGLTVRRFFMLRAVRLYPLYGLGLAIGVAKQFARLAGAGGADMVQGWRFPVAALLNASLLPMPFTPAPWFPFNPPAWSLFFEGVVNLLFAAYLFKASSRALLVLALASSLVLVAGLDLRLFGLDATSLNLGWSRSTAAGGLARVLLSFPLGILLQRWVPVGRARRSVAALLPLMVVVIALNIPLPAALRPWGDLVAATLVLPLTVLLGLIWETPQVMRRFCSLLGDLSYPVYAIHVPLVFAFVSLTHRLGLSDLAGCAVFLVAVGVLAALAARLVDLPARRFLSRRLHQRFSAPDQVLA